MVDVPDGRRGTDAGASTPLPALKFELDVAYNKPIIPEDLINRYVLKGLALYNNLLQSM